MTEYKIEVTFTTILKLICLRRRTQDGTTMILQNTNFNTFKKFFKHFAIFKVKGFFTFEKRMIQLSFVSKIVPAIK